MTRRPDDSNLCDMCSAPWESQGPTCDVCLPRCDGCMCVVEECACQLLAAAREKKKP